MTAADICRGMCDSCLEDCAHKDGITLRIEVVRMKAALEQIRNVVAQPAAVRGDDCGSVSRIVYALARAGLGT